MFYYSLSNNNSINLVINIRIAPIMHSHTHAHTHNTTRLIVVPLSALQIKSHEIFICNPTISQKQHISEWKC